MYMAIDAKFRSEPTMATLNDKTNRKNGIDFGQRSEKLESDSSEKFHLGNKTRKKS